VEERHVVDQFPQPRPARVHFVHRRQRRTQPILDPPAQNGCQSKSWKNSKFIHSFIHSLGFNLNQ
jgi:hypothetical protein